MEPTVISVQEGEIILRRGDRVTAADLKKYRGIFGPRVGRQCVVTQAYICYHCHPPFGVVYISLVLPSLVRWTTLEHCSTQHCFKSWDFPFHYGIGRDRII